MKQKKKEEISLRKIEKSNKQQGEKKLSRKKRTNYPESESVLDVEKKNKTWIYGFLDFSFSHNRSRETKNLNPFHFVCYVCYDVAKQQ